MDSVRYWVNVVSKEHVQQGVAGGFTQADHGDDRRLKRLTKGDRVVFYSPRPAHSFTAIGEVVDEAPYQEESAWRRRMKFATSAETDIRPLIGALQFIPNKESWGVTFRRGFFQIEERDFKTIAAAMKAEDSAQATLDPPIGHQPDQRHHHVDDVGDHLMHER